MCDSITIKESQQLHDDKAKIGQQNHLNSRHEKKRKKK